MLEARIGYRVLIRLYTPSVSIPAPAAQVERKESVPATPPLSPTKPTAPVFVVPAAAGEETSDESQPALNLTLRLRY